MFAVLYIDCWRKTYRVVGVRHGVEWSNSQWELIQDVEVGVILQQKTTQSQCWQSVAGLKSVILEIIFKKLHKLQYHSRKRSTLNSNL